MIDRYGLTVSAATKNILNGAHADKSKWDITIEDFGLSIKKNLIESVTFNGELNIPAFGEYSLLPYTATYNRASEEFDFKCNVAGEKDFPALSSKLTINESSYIDIRLSNDEFYPTVSADGTITIDANVAGDKFKLNIPDVKFEGLRISREKPYFSPGIWNFSELEFPKIGGFSLAIKDLNFVNDAVKLTTDVSLNEKIKGSGTFNINSDF